MQKTLGIQHHFNKIIISFVVSDFNPVEIVKTIAFPSLLTLINKQSKNNQYHDSTNVFLSYDI